jgi:nitrogenase subunit NifH
MYNDRRNIIRLIKAKVPMGDPVQRAVIRGVALGEMEPDEEDYGVFQFLKEEVLKKSQPTVH